MKINPRGLPRFFDPGMLPGTPEAAILIKMAPDMFRFLASLSRRPNAPAKIDVDRMLALHGVEISDGSS